jgi:tRNA-guanine family transglycosylase
MFEYVGSGTSYFKLMYEESYRPENMDVFAQTYGSLNGQHDHKISLLYNAFTERRTGPRLKENYAKYLHSIHADSGGLQIITLGKTITPELKEEIYANQAQNSDIAMCFDMIPVRVLSDRSERLDLENRRFDPSMLESCARETGKNLRRQIDHFDEKKSSARPMLITQGNDYDSYMKWVEYVAAELTPYHIGRIGGIAMGAAALGKGPLEDIKRAFYFTQLPIELESRHLHLLGVGSVYRMLPNIVFIQNGLYQGVQLSYDSTTHTSGVTQGRYYISGDRVLNGKYRFADYQMTFNRVFDDNYRIIWEDICDLFPCMKQYSLDTFYEVLQISARTYEEKYGNIDPSIQIYIAYVSACIKNFMRHVERVNQSQENLIDFARGTDKNAFKFLYDVKNTNDFDNWLRHIGKTIESEPVKVMSPEFNLEELFA